MRGNGGVGRIAWLKTKLHLLYFVCVSEAAEQRGEVRVTPVAIFAGGVVEPPQLSIAGCSGKLDR